MSALCNHPGDVEIYLEPSPFLRPLCSDLRLERIELAEDCRVRGVNDPLLNNGFENEESIVCFFRFVEYEDQGVC